MSSIPAVRCDRCNARTLLGDDGFLSDGWGQVRVKRGKPFFDTGLIDLCPDCIKVVYEMARPRSIVKGKA